VRQLLVSVGSLVATESNNDRRQPKKVQLAEGKELRKGAVKISAVFSNKKSAFDAPLILRNVSQEIRRRLALSHNVEHIKMAIRVSTCENSKT